MKPLSELVLISIALSWLTCLPARAETIDGVSEVQGIQSIRLAWKGERTKPIVVTSAEDLAKIMPNRVDAHTVGHQIDFEKQQLLIFAWEGDAQDRVNVSKEQSKLKFAHWGNLAGEDPHLHCKIFIIPQKMLYSSAFEPDPR